ncbi:unnamed protein product [Rotaria magnacalcarata]|uniref:dynamin GTPase n=3 Tax=Rotaria magnacalcarata TaxID=392030 RepID=A0A8S2KBF6_9BILA|nr:unnamed protein product [Rotaria magnacalcarata]
MSSLFYWCAHLFYSKYPFFSDLAMSTQAGNPNMELLIPMINQLQHIFTAANAKLTLTLPQIAVVGSQSAGKSSVLENIVGRDFLPRGGNMVTKRPLVLQLINLQGQEYAVFGHKPQQRFVNYVDVRAEIENDTKSVVRDDMGVSNIPINLTIYSPHVVNLTLVDLPGMVKVPSQGQPPDIVKKIDDIIINYISNENCLILAVTPANIDIVTSDALVMARSQDPMGKRTIGVLTKLDMMGKGHNAREVLLNKLVVLERGFIGVVLRGQRLDEHGRASKELDIAGALEFERQFFQNESAYRDIADRMGVPYLQRSLSLQLTEHILKCLPELKRDLQGRFRDLSKEVTEYRASAMYENSTTSDTKALVGLTHELREDFDTALQGNNLKEADLKTLTGGARIANIFRERFPFELVKVELQDKDMRNQTVVAIKNIRGFRSGLFTPDEAFEYIVQMQISKFEDPIMKCVDMVASELGTIVHEATSKMKRYPLLRQAAEELLIQYLKEREIAAKQACSAYIQTQLAYINTNNEDFIGFASAEKSVNSGETKRHVTNQIIRKGYLRVHTGVKLFQAKDFFFVLSTDNLSWFTDADEKDKKYMLPLENLKIRDVEGSFMAKRPQFAIFTTEGKNVYKEHKVLELSVDNAEELDTWKASFLRAGVYPEREQRQEDSTSAADVGPVDPHMERQVETINKLVSSYMQIVAKMTRDYIPKAIMYNIVQNVQKFVAKELLAHLYALPDPKSLLQESEEERLRREAKIAEYEAIKNALSIIENFHNNARKIAGSVIPVSVVVAGMSSASTNPSMNSNNFAPTSNYPSNSLDTTFYYQQQTLGGRPSSPNTLRKQPAPMFSNPNAFGSRDPPPPPLRPNPVANPTGGNFPNFPAQMMNQPAQYTKTSYSSSSNLIAELDPFATPVLSAISYQNGFTMSTKSSPMMNQQGRASPQLANFPSPLTPLTSRFKQYSVAQQQQQNQDNHDADANLAFTIPREYITRGDLTSASLFHGGIDSPSVNAIDPILEQPVHITKYLCLKSKTSTQQYIDHLYERIVITSNLSHPNVRRILSWYIADACLYAVTGVVHRTLRHAIQSETFSLERISLLSLQIIQGTIYLQSKGLGPLTPWYTTNIELTCDDRIRLCSPTISKTKLNGGIVPHHHLWRHAPESLIRMIIEQDDLTSDKTIIDHTKEDVWSIGCIIIEMMINTMLFRPQNDEPSLQLFCIVQYVGGLTLSLYERFPSNVKILFSKIRLDSHQQRLHNLLKQIINQETLNLNEHHFYTKENLFDLLKAMFQFQPEKRTALHSLSEHPFYSMNSSMKNYKTRMNSLTSILPLNTSSISIDDLIRLCIKLNLQQSRWVLTLKERCLFELILHIKNFNLLSLYKYGLSPSLHLEIKRLIYFFTNN